MEKTRGIHTIGKLFLLVCILYLSGTTALYAQDNQVRLKADRVVYNEKDGNLTLLGNVRFTHRDAVLTGDRATFNNRTQTGNVRGNVKITQPGTVVTAEKMDVFYNKTQAQLQGNVALVTTRAPGISGGSGTGATYSKMTAPTITYNWIQRTGTATGGVAVVQGNRRAYGSRATYDGNARLITLEGSVRFEQGSNNWVTAQRVVVDMQNNTILATGGVSGTFYVETQEGKPPGKGSFETERIPDKIPSPELPFLEKKIPE